MNWVRKAFVGFLAFILFVSLLWGVSAYNVQTKLSHPEKVESWLADSGIYDHAVEAILKQTQEESTKNGTSASVSFTNPEIQSAAESVFTKDLVRTNANKFIDSNYAWLSGETSTPEFSIDLTQAKQDFASKVGEYVEKRLASLSACSPEQLAKLQIPIDPSTATCRPGSLDPATEGKRVADEIANGSDFLEKPVITADTLNQTENDSDKPYYENLKSLPKIYQLGQKLAWVFALLAVICSIGIIFIHPSRRKGYRRVGTTLTVAGILLVATKLASSMLTSKLEGKVLTNSTKDQLDQSVTNFLQTVESQLSQSNMMFGIIFVVIGLAILIYLFTTRDGRERKQKPHQVNTPDQPVETLPLSSPENRPQPPVNPDISDRMRTPRPTGPPLLGDTPRPNPHTGPAGQQGSPKSRPPKPPRLIQ